MQGIVLTVGDYQVSAMQAAFGFGLAVVVLLVWMVLSLRRSSFERTLEAAAATERAREMDDKVAEMNRLQAELTSRMQTMAEIFGSRQSDMTRLVAERLDGLRSHRGSYFRCEESP